MRKIFRNALIVCLIAGLVAINIYTGLSANTKSSNSYPGYPSIMFAYNAGNITVLIRGALGPYFYNNITVTGYYNYSAGPFLKLVKYADNTYYLGFKVHALYMSISATAIDSSQSTEYYYNATLTVNPSATGSTETQIVGSNAVHILVVGDMPYVGAMEGVRIG